GRQRAGLHRRLHGATRLDAMAAVAEPAAGRVALDVLEGLLHRVADVPELQLAHARRVEQQAAAGNGHELAVGRGVTPFRVGLAHGARLLDVRAHETVDDGA